MGIIKSQDFRYRLHPQAARPLIISPFPHFGHFNTTGSAGAFSFFEAFFSFGVDSFSASYATSTVIAFRGEHFTTCTNSFTITFNSSIKSDTL